MEIDQKAAWKTDTAQQLIQVLCAINKPEPMQHFLRDVLTEKEIIEISARLEAAKMLKEGKKYAEIIQATKLSSRTVARISEWAKNGTGGYKIALDTITSAS